MSQWLIVVRFHSWQLTLKFITMKRKFQHFAINALLYSLMTLAFSGIVMIIIHLAFNNPTITFGGW